MLRSFVQGYKRLLATFVAQHTCPICLNNVPINSSCGVASEVNEVHTKLRCCHRFCAVYVDCVVCIQRYIELKLKYRQVEDVLNCKKSIQKADLERIIGKIKTAQYRIILKRKRAEKNPSARWCPRPSCDELIICESKDNFTCPKCNTVGCFRCRGYSHRFWFCRGDVDKSYLAWEASVGNRKAVRACPHCQMRIWKNEGCNHMTCTQCRYEYCWVCESTWDASHYACYDLPFIGASSAWGQWLQRTVGYAGIILIVVVVAAFGFYAFVGCYVFLFSLVHCIKLIQRAVNPSLQTA
ncbi:hypothetical protein CCR75_002325 [Bremia lactucae]|uniref:RBR-type E3 ubiquitin transferase n=1 Tax=Bremia lactucae TaxID=4779 RepID=A0A976IKW5_BRELC|nr:hypothetical protein CCR75_002325 [Bremia lactucae]